MKDKNENYKSEIAKKEEGILKFWQENKIFEKTLEKESPQGNFVFYDGPPFATGVPHYGHIVAGTIKDVIPRYRTMFGYKVRRRWGWDCHGLPIENLIEKKLGLKTKKDIIDYGIEKFNAEARASVLHYADEWKQVVPRLGRFVDMEDDYRTMDASYSETVWWTFKQLYEKNLIYEGYKSMHICPRCETTLSNFEVSQGYKDVTDISVIVKFALSGESETFILAWTTTPWTLPGNVALAINPEITYVKIKIGSENYILAKERLIIIKEDFEIISEFSGRDLIGIAYKPVFYYYSNDSNLENKQNGWKIYGADFVSTTEGTGVVHLAPAFGEDDLKLGQENNLPFIQHVSIGGAFKPEVTDWSGLSVKPATDPISTDVLIIKYLAAKKLLFAKEKFTHSYPHCWRCQTPLLNYAASSWFVKVTAFRDKLVSANQKVNWVPAHLRDGRFGKWLENARDWAISRLRFWGAPLPVWRCSGCQAVKVLGSFAELAENLNLSGNKYWAMRHGEAESNVLNLISADPLKPDHLTDKGRQMINDEVEKVTREQKIKKIDLIVSSDFVRTKETANAVAEKLGLRSDQIIFDQRLREINPGSFSGRSWSDYNLAFGSRLNRLYEHPIADGENYNDVRRRITSVIRELDLQYKNKNILIISHGLPLYMLWASTNFFTDQDIAKSPKRGTDFSPAEIRPIDFIPFPCNQNGEIDIHRPFIDQIVFSCSCGGHFHRVPEVFDCWYESGVMPYAQDHYPFEKNNLIDPVGQVGFPADFISEGLDQTRGWFYSLIILGLGLFDKCPYQNVVTNGLVLAEDGQKMSKSLKNYPDLMSVANRYGADSLRLYLMSSPAVRGEDLNFSEKGVEEISRRLVARILNVLSFYQTYTNNNEQLRSEISLAELFKQSTNILDRWILALLVSTTKQMTTALDNYEIEKSVELLDGLIDNFSTWYIRRSRDRFKVIESSDRQSAVSTTYFVLLTISKLLAPLAPFTSEIIYQDLKTQEDLSSVHLNSWPDFSIDLDKKIIDEMNQIREIISQGLELRQSAGIKVRQPLLKLSIKDDYFKDKDDYLALIRDELNVKTVEFNLNLSQPVDLDITITEELHAEGLLRELIRQIQEERKRIGLMPGEKANLSIVVNDNSQAFLEKSETILKTATSLQDINYLSEVNDSMIKVTNWFFQVEPLKL